MKVDRETWEFIQSMTDEDFHEVCKPMIDAGIIELAGVNAKGKQMYRLVDRDKADAYLRELNGENN